MSPEATPGAFCLRNLNLDCPTNCPLYPEARRAVEEIAEKNEETVAEAIAEVRGMPEKKIEETNHLNNGILYLSGASERCKLKDRI